MMKQLKFRYRFSIAFVLSLEVAIAPSPATALSQASKQSNPPPPPTNPGSSAAGGRRDPLACPQDAEATTASPTLTALSPITQAGLTLMERPTFLVYVPRTSAENAEFSLSSRDGHGVYRTTVALTNTPNIISITLPTQAESLEIGKSYNWSFAIICNPSDRLEDRFVTGSVQRIELDLTRLQQIEQADLIQRLMLYQEDDLWYDAIALLFELKRTQPNNPSIRAAWQEFLQSGGIDTMIGSSLN
jgi:hypothetical protein